MPPCGTLGRPGGTPASLDVLNGTLRKVDFAPGQLQPGPARPAIVDRTDVVAESNESNNIASRANTCP